MLGVPGDALTQSYQSLIQQAMATGLYVTIRFPDGHDCSANDYTTLPLMVNVSLEPDDY